MASLALEEGKAFSLKSIIYLKLAGNRAQCVVFPFRCNWPFYAFISEHSKEAKLLMFFISLSKFHVRNF